MNKTRLSSKGQIIIPQAIRETHKWLPGLEFTVIDTAQGLLLTPINPFKANSMHDVLGCTGYKGKKKSLKDMRAVIAKGAKQQKMKAVDTNLLI